jgi:hypothetical protein
MSVAGSTSAAGGSAPGASRVRWFSGRSMLLHLALLVWIPGCFVAMWWQITVGLAGNPLGWLYAIEWPVFAILGAVGWWQLIHDDEETVRARRWTMSRAKVGPAPAEEGTGSSNTHEPAAPVFDEGALRSIERAEEEDEELAAYNAYLARLATSGEAKTWRNPTGADR